MKKFMFIMIAAMSLSFAACTSKQTANVDVECAAVCVDDVVSDADSMLVEADTVAVDTVVTE